MRVIKRQTLVDYYTKGPKAKDALEYWYDKTVKATWSCYADMKRHTEFMNTIKTKEQYDEAIRRIEELYRLTDEDTPACDPMMVEMDMLGRAIEAYEDIHYPIAKPTLAAVLRLRMYEMGLNQKRLAELLHVSRSRISSYMSGKSEPTLKTARTIAQKLNIDASTILGV